ncbi:hypothetical protein SAMN05192550_3164 [Flavobacterium glycines]|uniref:Lipocalin-like domain-containing protein n=1 Tax=Flavobacterium glycines TaxID=551990 RepID=A0A1B9DX19_9FLAO|nr:hypothetical protein [Flavobacterium glycines]OCB74225.1 hypothetical protein FBGL_02125 [Flavobacterium glycines]GEL12265.1 hypothetical protein FGL01_30040 [Flavobacterium glycines]SDK01167.1 hypothetical protein SAMN05192550_3164 [Flavobacterium glycines]
MSRKNLAYLIVFAFFLSFCSLKNEEDVINEHAIIGTWHWKESRGGFSGNEIVTPESTGVTIKLVFGANKKVIVFTNDVETGIYEYTVKMGKTIFDNELHYLLNFNQMSYVILNVDNKEMSIQDNFPDGYVLTYTK